MGALVSGTRVGRYVVLEELGGGGMGVVYRARDDEGREIALKVLRRSDPEAIRRMHREARATEALDHARIAQVYEIGETPDGEPYLAMEYVAGKTLRALMRERVMPARETLRVITEIGATLGEAHRAGVVHRDVKPENVIVREDGRVVLLDFGIAKDLAPATDASQASTQLTAEGTIVGTLAYLAPEQALGRHIGPAADQFALAVTAFEMLTGRLPWTSTEVTRVLAQILADTPPAASSVAPGISAAYDAVLWRALSKDPSARFASTEDFARALDSASRARAPLGSGQRAGIVALLVVGLGASGAWIHAHVGASAAASSPTIAAPVASIGSSDAPLGCPIFDVVGLPEIGTWVGAAASSLACDRAKWYLGGRDDRVAPPARLLDAPVVPTADLPKLYDLPDQRARTLDAIGKRGLGYVDGRVTRSGNAWLLDLSLHASNGGEVAHVAGVEADQLGLAIKNGMSRLWERVPHATALIDPDVARWTGIPDIATGLTTIDIGQGVDTLHACATLAAQSITLGTALYGLHALCDEPAPDAGTPALDESSPSKLVTSLNAMISVESTPPRDELRRLAQKLEELHSSEPTPLGRAYLADTSAAVWDLLEERDRARTSLLAALSDDPLLFDAWGSLANPMSTSGSSADALALASLWFPYDPAFLSHASSSVSDDLDARLHDARLAYLIFPGLRRVLYLGRALAEAGREDDVRALTTVTPIGRSSPDPNEGSMLLAFIDLHDAKLGRALERLESSGMWGLYQVPIVAQVLGRGGVASTKWATSLLAMDDASATEIVSGEPSTIALCMNADAALATRCLARVEKLGASNNSWGANGAAFLRGAKRYAAGDRRGAIDAWRPVVGGPDDNLVRLLPTEAFQRGGEEGLAARVDAHKLKYRYFAGISDATPREATRAIAAGDVSRARELAQKVVDAWGSADAVVPAVAEMRALLAKIAAR